MKVLIACEYSGTVREAFKARGHEAWSCDLLPTEIPGNHIQGDVLDILNNGWDMVIAHPPCTYLTSAGHHWVNKDNRRVYKILEGAKLFMDMYLCNSKKVCIENPAGSMTAIFRAPDQTIHPYYFGESDLKRTCLWLRGLPKLIHNKTDDLFAEATHSEKPQPKYIDYTGKKRYFTDSISGGANQGHLRSKSFQSIANAMAEQWG